MLAIRNFCLGISIMFAGALAAPPAVDAAEPAQDEDLAYAIGVQTYISHFPLMDLYRTLWETSFDPDRGHDRTLNEFYAFERLATSEDDFIVSPNNDTTYLRAFVDLRAEPIVLVIPPMGDRKYWVPVGDMWHDHDANLSFDTVGSQGGAFAMVAPGWQGVLPEGVRRVEMTTPLGWLLPRLLVASEEDLAAAVDLQQQFRLVPLSQWGAADASRPQPDPAGYPRLTRTDLTDARTYFTVLNAVLRLSPRLGNPMDTAMASWMHEIDMDPATGFDWDALSPQTQAGLTRATADAHRIITARTQRSVPIVNYWQLARFDPRISGDPVFAAAASMIGLLWNPAEINTYDLAFQDGTGAQLDGRTSYVLRLDPPPPVDGFWSVTMYSAETRIFVPNAIDRYSIGDRTPGLVYGEDGSIEIVMQVEEPTDPVERANWLPAPEGPFYLLMRHYSPRSEILTGDWVPPAIVER